MLLKDAGLTALENEVRSFIAIGQIQQGSDNATFHCTNQLPELEGQSVQVVKEFMLPT